MRPWREALKDYMLAKGHIVRNERSESMEFMGFLEFIEFVELE
jgi:hypothetical protein